MSGGNVKSPSLSDPNSYNETLNASLRAALGDSGMLLASPHLGSSVSQESAEDLSIRSQPNGQVPLPSLALARDDLLLNIKQEPSNEPEPGPPSAYLDSQETGSSQGLYADGQESQGSLALAADPSQEAGEDSMVLGEPEQSQGEAGPGGEGGRMEVEPPQEDGDATAAALGVGAMEATPSCSAGDAVDEREATGDGFPMMQSGVTSPSPLPHSTAVGVE